MVSFELLPASEPELELELDVVLFILEVVELEEPEVLESVEFEPFAEELEFDVEELLESGIVLDELDAVSLEEVALVCEEFVVLLLEDGSVWEELEEFVVIESSELFDKTMHKLPERVKPSLQSKHVLEELQVRH